MKILILILSFLILLSLVATAEARQFECRGERSMIASIKGVYLGEASDEILLETSSVYQIFNKEGDRILRLSRLSNSGQFLIFQVTQQDDLGRLTTKFKMPLGVFGAGPGKKFEASLTSFQASRLECEITGW